VSRTIVVWMVGIAVTATLGESDSSYKWETLDLRRIAVELVGFLGVMAGNLVYNNIIKL